MRTRMGSDHAAVRNLSAYACFLWALSCACVRATASAAAAPPVRPPACQGAAERLVANEENVTAFASLIVTDTDDNVPEWVAYHLLLGFDRILVVDANRTSPVLAGLSSYPFANDGRVVVKTVQRDEADGLLGGPRPKEHLLSGTVLPFMREAAPTWFISLDGDEYLNLGPRYGRVQDFLAAFPDAAQLPIRWRQFGTARRASEPESALVMESFTRAIDLDDDDWAVPELGLEDPGGHIVKTFVRTAAVVGVRDLHWWMLAPGALGTQPFAGGAWVPSRAVPYGGQCGTEELVAINHYMFRSLAHTLQTKLLHAPPGPVRDSLARLPLPELSALIHGHYNDVEDRFLADYWAPRVREMLLTSPHCSVQRRLARDTRAEGLPIS